ncbi:DUF2585 domain-containing protein [Roseiarcaceae bacterium H3SJ34-1]|uniref:DUF2585 domain-containing protein n=1 Tax=Terripilifer ovatus TaxID=3032367 RepID=UPI003AB9456A|nr:DUF2585 domain-containing protein [Roseiarcaceae bacterium H3SJ34-1]
MPAIINRLRAMSHAQYAAIVAGLIAIQVMSLFALGHPPICTCGSVKLWQGDVLSAENSQHLTDWYTFSHIIHGFGFYLLLWLIAPRTPTGLRFAIAVGLEAGWEILENTPLIMDRYRESALAQGYFGDSIINSVSDVLAMALGFFLARQQPVWLTVVLALAMELFVGYMIRDNLTLNIIQLIHPNAALSRWQAGE